MKLPENFILIDKPIGMTSFDVIRELRRSMGIKKWGHAGTLDPLATGLMLLAHDIGTKRLTEFIKLDKEYIAEIRIGERRSTGDMEGDILQQKKVVEAVEIFSTKISTALESMLGTLTLPASAYSAIKKDGVPMYKRARKAEQKGELIADVPEREMVVYEAQLLDVECTGDRCIATVRFRVGSGTYIRSLGENLGQLLGYPTTLQNLRRMKVGKFRIENAQQLTEVMI